MPLLFPHEIAEFEKLIDRERAAKEAERLFGERKMDLVRVLDERGLMHELPAKGAADQVWLELMAKYQV